MTPLQFEALYQAEWQELENLLDRVFGRVGSSRDTVRGERLATLYRRACEHLALARARAYPAYLLDRLEKLTAEAHQAIYQRQELGLTRVREFVAVTFPRTVRAHAAYVWVATAVLTLPTLIVGMLVYRNPEMILSVVDAWTAAGFEAMYSESAEALGRLRQADTDWVMFGFYIRNNITVAFQCFASGLFVGLGSLFFLAYNGLYMGAIGGYLTERGLSATFYSFVATHSSFELTAIVLSGAAGLRIGHALLAPGRYTRKQALVLAGRESALILTGAVFMLLVAAAIEAFWSSAQWIPSTVKYSVAAACWLAVLLYLTLQGRDAS